MKLTEIEAIEKSIELWAWLVKTGADCKIDWSGWDEIGRCLNNCFLCEYDKQEQGNNYKTEVVCACCPYYRRFGFCAKKTKTTYSKWRHARTKVTRKKYALLFLTQLKELKKEAIKRGDE